MVQPLARKLISLAAAYEDLGPWRLDGTESPVLIRIPGIDHPIAANVIGHAADQFGLILFVDKRGVERLLRLAIGALDGDVGYGLSHIVAFSLDPSDEVRGAYRKVLKAGGYRPRPLKRTPNFAVQEPNADWRPIKQGEARTMALCLHAVLCACKAGAFEEFTDRIDPERELLELTLSSDAIEASEMPAVTWKLIPSPVAEEAAAQPHDLDDVDSAPETAEDWSRVIDIVSVRLLDAIPDEQRAGRSQEYWGEPNMAVDLINTVTYRQAISTFYDWLVIDYRAEGTHPTFVEQALEHPEDWSEHERIALTALLDCEIRPYLVEAQGAGVVELTDRAHGAKLTAHGLEFPNARSRGLGVLMRVIEVGGHTVCRTSGPGLRLDEFDLTVMGGDALSTALEGDGLRNAGSAIGDLWLSFAKT